MQISRKGLDGSLKGFTTASIIILVALSVIFTASYILTAFATVSLTSNNVVFANATFDTNQTGIDLNLTINLTSIGNGQVTPVRTIYINISEAGFVNITATNLRCPDNATGAHGGGQQTWNATSPNTGVLACNASTSGGASSANNTLTGVVQVRILGLTSRSSPGTPTFNVSIEYNVSAFVSNSSAVQITLLELQASSSLNDTTTGIHEQRSYNFTVTNNATDPDNFDTIDEIRIDYTLSGFKDTGGSNVTCPKIPPTSGVSWDLVNDSANNIIRCSKPAGTGSALGKGSSTNVVVNNWGASPIAQTRRFIITVNGTTANGTYTVANESSPNVVVNGTINVTGSSKTPSTIARNATNTTLMLYNFSTVGEQFNISVIKLTLSGSAAAADFDTVTLVNDTDRDGILDATDLPVFNASVLTSARQYEFLGISYPVRDNNTLLLVVNISGSATGGRTYRFNLNASSDVNSLGGSSGSNVTETINSGESNQGTIHGTLVVNGFNLAPATKSINTANLAMAYFEFNASGEGMNITSINLTRTGSAADADVALVRIFNDTNANAAFDSGTDTQLGGALNASASGQYIFSGFQFNISTGGINRLIVVTNLTAGTGGRLVSFGINRTGDLNFIGATTGENFTGTTNVSFVGAQSSTMTIHGTLTVVGKALGANTTAINSTGFAVLLLNFTANGEQVNVTQINLTRTGTAADGDGIFNVTLFNDTDRSGTLTTGDLAIVGAAGVNVTTGSAYLFRTISFNVTTAGTSVIAVVSTNDSTSTGGATFNLSINATGSINAFTASSNVNITGSPNITLTATNGNVTRIFGTLVIAGTDLTPATANDGQLDVPILNLTFTAAGEQMNITQLNISMNNTNNDDVSAIKLYNDTDRSGAVNAGDFLVATATKSNSLSLAVFGTGTSQLFNVTAAADKRLIVTYDINSTAGGGNLVDANLSIAGNVLIAGSSSAISITSTGLPINPVGETQITDLVATATIDFTSTKITAINSYNFTVENTGGEAINSIMIDYTASSFFDIPTETDVLCPRIGGTNWTRAITNGTNTINCTSPGGGNDLAVGSKANITVKNFQAPASASNKTFIVQIRGTSGGFYNATTNGVTVSGFLNVTGTSQIASTIVVNSVNVSVILYNFTASGEQMNISVISLTRAGRNSRETDIVSVKLFNDTNLDGTYTATTDTTQFGTTQTSNNTGGQYIFGGLQFNVTASANQSVFAVVEIAGVATSIIRQINFTINTTDGVNAIGATTAVNITENLTATTSTSSSIFGNLTVTGTNLVNSTVAIGTETSVMRLNFTSVGEGFNITIVNVSVIGSATEANLTNVRLVNDTNGNGIFDSGTDTTLGPQWNATSGVTFKLLNTTTQFNVSTSGINSVFIVVNTSTAAGTSGKTFNLSINGTGDVEAVGAVTATNVTEVLATTRSNQATVGGTFSITGKNLAPSTRAISVSGISVLQLNLTSTNEGMNISVIKLTRGGTAGDNHIFNVTLYNDTDLSGTFNAGDTRIGTTQNTTASSKYEFLGINYNITTAAHTILVVLSTNATAGNTFNLSLASSDDINSIGATSSGNVTETLTTTGSSTTTIHGTLTITGKSIAPATKAASIAGLGVLQLNISPAGEAMNVTVLNITRTGSAVDGEVFNVSLFNDTDLSGGFNAGDTLIGSPLNTSASGNYSFASLGFNVPTAGKTLFVVLTTNDTAGRTFNFSLVTTGNINVIGATSGENLSSSSNVTLTTTQSTVTTTIHGTVTITGTSLVDSAVSVSTAGISVIRFNITPAGEGVNITVINVTRGGNASDGHIFNVSLYNDTDLSGTFNSGDVIISGSANALNTSTSGQYIFTGFQFNVSTSGKSIFLVATSNSTADVTFRLGLNGTGSISLIGASTAENLTGSTNMTLTSTGSSVTEIVSLAITGTSLAPSTKAINSANVSILRLNITAGGEGMNISVIKITRNESALDADIEAARLINDTNLNGIFDTTDTQIGATVNSTSAGQYEFGNLSFNIPEGGSKSLIVVVNLTSGTAGRTFRFNINASSDVNTISATTAINITETLTTPVSSRTTIHGLLTVTGTNLTASTVALGTANVTVIRFNFTATGEGMNITVFNITRSGSATDSDVVFITLYNDTDGSGTFNAGDARISNQLNSSSSGIYAFNGTQFNVSTSGVNSIFLIVNTTGTGGQTFNFSIKARGDLNVITATSGQNLTGTTNVTLTTTESTTTTISGTITITGKTLNTANVNASTAGYSVLQFNFTSSGEAMNVTVIKITLKGSATSDHINNLTLFNDTDLSGTFNSGDSSLGTSGVNTTTTSQYVFTGFQFNITPGGTKTLIAVVTVNGSTTAGGKNFNLSINATSDVNTIGATSGVNITETLTTTEAANTTSILGTLTIRGVDLVETDANRKSDRTLYSIPSNEANIPLLRLNFSAVGEGMNITVIRINRSAPTTVTAASDTHMRNLRLFNDTNGNGRFDSSSDTQIGSALDASASNIYSFAGFQYNITASTLGTLFVVFNSTDASWNPDVAFNFSLLADADVNSIGAVSATNVTEAYITGYSNTTRITEKGWYNISQVLEAGWNTDFLIPHQAIIETTGRNATNTGNFNFTTMLNSLGSSWTHMYYNINGSDNGWVLATRTDFAGSTLQYVNNTNSDAYRINMTISERFEL